MTDRGRWRAALAVACLAWATASCRGGEPSPALRTTISPVSIPPGVATGVAWQDDETLWLGLDADPTVQRPETVPWLVDMSTGDATRIPLEDDGCFLGDYLSAQRGGGTGAAFVLSCIPAEGAGAGLFKEEKSLVIVETDGSMSLVADLPAGATSVAWSPENSRGIVSAGSRICQGLGWVDPSGVEPIDILVPGTAARLGDDLRRSAGDCQDLMRADSPAWSANGEWLALAASPDSIGRSDRLRAPWNLYMMEVGTTDLHLLVQGVESAQGIAISPDGLLVTFSGSTVGESGMFLVDRVSGAIVRLDETPAYVAAFSPEGSRIVALRSPSDVRLTDVAIFSLASD